MSGIVHWLETLWWTRQPPLLLRGLARIYAAISCQHLERRATHPFQPPLPLISVGNITVGGSGKTPFVIWLAKALRKHGHSPVVLCRGDGGSSSRPLLLDEIHSASEAGDEARLLFEQSGCPVIAAQDRIEGSQLAEELGNIIILDDGFQYRHLARCCDIVLVPAEGVGNGFGLPAGPLREPISALDRADLIVRTGDAEIVPLQRNHPERRWQARPAGLADVMQTGAEPPVRCLAACGIARPDRFLADLESIGISVVESRLFPDHHPFDLSEVAGLLGSHLPVIVTGKDAVKLKPVWPADVPLWILQQKADADDDLLEAILACLPEGRSGS